MSVSYLRSGGDFIFHTRCMLYLCVFPLLIFVMFIYPYCMFWLWFPPMFHTLLLFSEQDSRRAKHDDEEVDDETEMSKGKKSDLKGDRETQRAGKHRSDTGIGEQVFPTNATRVVGAWTLGDDLIDEIFSYLAPCEGDVMDHVRSWWDAYQVNERKAFRYYNNEHIDWLHSHLWERKSMRN